MQRETTATALTITLDPEPLRVSRAAGQVLRHAREVGVVLRAEVVDAQHALVVADVGDGDADGGGRGRRQRRLVAVPRQAHGQVAVRDGAQHGHALTQTEVLANAKLVDGRRD